MAAMKITASGSGQLSQQQRTTALGRMHQATSVTALDDKVTAVNENNYGHNNNNDSNSRLTVERI